MGKPTTREQFKDYCLRKLGFPVIEINVDEDQVEDRVDEALDFYYQFHNEGSHLTWLSHQIDATDMANKYLTVNEEIIGVRRILPITDKNNIGGMWDLRYQWRLNDLYNFSSVQLNYYTSTMQHLALINQILVGEAPIRFNRHMDRVYIDMDWENDVSIGEWIVMEAWMMVDPETYSDVYGDRMLGKYATALIKKQWGNNLKKYQGVQLIGGVDMNGQQIYDEAEAEIKELEEEMRRVYELPCRFFVG